jgi:hypothetical protein
MTMVTVFSMLKPKNVGMVAKPRTAKMTTSGNARDV